jgi:ribosomal protein S18 acetylase RimI-like enzyme
MAHAVRALRGEDAAVAQRLVGRFHSVRVSAEYLATLLANPSNLLLVAELDDSVIGFLFGHFIERLRLAASQLFIYELEVVAEHRRKGVALALMSTALKRAAAQGVDAFVFTNHSNVPATALYRKLGGVAKNGDDLLFVFPISGHVG